MDNQKVKYVADEWEEEDLPDGWEEEPEAASDPNSKEAIEARLNEYPEGWDQMTLSQKKNAMEPVRRYVEQESAKDFFRGAASGVSLGLSENIPGFKPSGHGAHGLLGEAAGSILPLAPALNFVSKGLAKVAQKSPYMKKTAEALLDIIGAGVVGGVYGGATETLKGNKVDIEDVMTHGATWVALDAGLKTLGLVGRFGKALYEAATATGVPEKELMKQAADVVQHFKIDTSTNEKAAEVFSGLIEESAEAGVSPKDLYSRPNPGQQKQMLELDVPDNSFYMDVDGVSTKFKPIDLKNIERRELPVAEQELATELSAPQYKAAEAEKPQSLEGRVSPEQERKIGRAEAATEARPAREPSRKTDELKDRVKPAQQEPIGKAKAETNQRPVSQRTSEGSLNERVKPKEKEKLTLENEEVSRLAQEKVNTQKQYDEMPQELKDKVNFNEFYNLVKEVQARSEVEILPAAKRALEEAPVTPRSLKDRYIEPKDTPMTQMIEQTSNLAKPRQPAAGNFVEESEGVAKSFLNKRIERTSPAAGSRRELGGRIKADVEQNIKKGKEEYKPLYQEAEEKAHQIYTNAENTGRIAGETLKRIEPPKLRPKEYNETISSTEKALEDAGYIVERDKKTGEIEKISTKGEAAVPVSQLIELGRRLGEIINFETVLPEVKDLLKKIRTAVKDDIRVGLRQDADALAAFELAEEAHGRLAAKYDTPTIRKLRQTHEGEKVANLVEEPTVFHEVKDLLTPEQMNVVERELLDKINRSNAEKGQELLREFGESLSAEKKQLAKDIIASKNKNNTVARTNAVQQAILDDLSNAFTTGERPEYALKLWQTTKGQWQVAEAMQGSPNWPATKEYLMKQSFNDMVASVLNKETGVVDIKKLGKFLEQPGVIANIRKLGGDEAAEFFLNLESKLLQFRDNAKILDRIPTISELKQGQHLLEKTKIKNKKALEDQITQEIVKKKEAKRIPGRIFEIEDNLAKSKGLYGQDKIKRAGESNARRIQQTKEKEKLLPELIFESESNKPKGLYSQHKLNRSADRNLEARAEAKRKQQLVPKMIEDTSKKQSEVIGRYRLDKTARKNLEESISIKNEKKRIPDIIEQINKPTKASGHGEQRIRKAAEERLAKTKAEEKALEEQLKAKKQKAKQEFEELKEIGKRNESKSKYGENRLRKTKEKNKQKQEEVAAEEAAEVAAEIERNKTPLTRGVEFFKDMLGFNPKGTLSVLTAMKLGIPKAATVFFAYTAMEKLLANPAFRKAFLDAARKNTNPMPFIIALEQMGDMINED